MISFFEWPDVKKILKKDHGAPVKTPLAFDHVSIGVASKEDLWSLKEKLEAADFWVSEVIDHGFIHSIYSFDPNHIPIEFSYAIPEVDIRKHPKMADTSPSTLALEGSEPQKNRWPKVKHTIPEAERCVYPGEGIILREGI